VSDLVPECQAVALTRRASPLAGQSLVPADHALAGAVTADVAGRQVRDVWVGLVASAGRALGPLALYLGLP
jgi:hypothetical protein